MSKSRTPRFLWRALFVSTASALVLCSFGLANPASAGVVTLCPNQATVGGFGGSSSNVVGPLDGTCGANSAVKIDIPASIDYGKLQFNSGMSGYPAGLTLGGLAGLSANVLFSSGGTDQPYFLLDFTDSSNSLGQTLATDQILMIEFQPNALVGNTLAVDPNTTLFNLFDNEGAGFYLQGGQSTTKTIAGWLAAFPALANEGLDGIWVAEGLTGGDTGPDSLTVNSLAVTTAATAVPEPATLALFGAGLAGLGALRRRRKAKAKTE